MYLIIYLEVLFHLVMHWWVDCFMCPDLGLNPQPWCIRTTPELSRPAGARHEEP